MKNAVSYPIESVSNALRLIHLLSEQGEVRVTSAAKHLGVAPSTAHRLLTMLVMHGFARQDSKRAYLPGWAAPRTARPGTSMSEFRGTVRPYLVRLSQTLGETVHLVVLRGTAARFLDGVEHPHELTVTSRAGITLPAHCTAGGKAILAHLRPSELAAMYPRGLPEIYGPGPRDLSTLRRQLNGVRRAGFAVNGEESERGIVGIGVCVRDSSGAVRGALAAGVPTTRCPNERIPTIARVLQECAEELHQVLLTANADPAAQPTA